MTSVLNVSAYLFTALEDLPALRERVWHSAQAHGLKGTVLLAEEGINCFVAGAPDAVREFVQTLRADPRLAQLGTKESFSSTQPFKRLRVKIKPEVIRMNHPTVRPQDERAPALAPQTLARWLAQGHDDEGRPVVMLDTRNGFEVDVGAFDGAIDWRLKHFSDFPAQLRAHLPELQGRTVVSYCTGGIRCEKAALLMRESGLPSVYQLEGGILGYFEHAPGAPHWRGNCFVFDEREQLAADLGVAT